MSWRTSSRWTDDSLNQSVVDMSSLTYVSAGKIRRGAESLSEDDWSALMWSSQTEAEEVEAIASSAASSSSAACCRVSCFRTSRSPPAAGTAAAACTDDSQPAAAATTAGDNCLPVTRTCFCDLGSVRVYRLFAEKFGWNCITLLSNRYSQGFWWWYRSTYVSFLNVRVRSLFWWKFLLGWLMILQRVLPSSAHYWCGMDYFCLQLACLHSSKSSCWSCQITLLMLQITLLNQQLR